MSDALREAERIADEVLLPAAPEVDAQDRVPHLDLLADAGFYGLASPESALDVPDYPTVQRIVETLASGCLATTFVWVQHHGAVIAVAETANADLRAEYLSPLTTGRCRAGLAATAAVRPGPPLLTAEAVRGGWVFDGQAPWVTGWDMIDVLHVAARDEHDVLVWALVDTAELSASEPLSMVAVQASRTVTLRFDRMFVPHERVTSTISRTEHLKGDPESLRFTGSLALGVARRAIKLMGHDETELDAARKRLHEAGHDVIPAARAQAAELALRTAAALVVHDGSRAVLPREHGQRLLREATFLLVFGTRPGIRAALLDRLLSGGNRLG
ncbi:acyl-CoA dehydrogenase family protein [Lentzea terrae]|uniref:acyl-CoA dehydrogenase family protein n=1 Tax=Lentzea terrae TaxID=2200761 RepID=UPI000DD4239A|nr:acyl-CoA dehydrogenase family protein [Lentzea terrae]